MTVCFKFSNIYGITSFFLFFSFLFFFVFNSQLWSSHLSLVTKCLLSSLDANCYLNSCLNLPHYKRWYLYCYQRPLSSYSNCSTYNKILALLHVIFLCTVLILSSKACHINKFSLFSLISL